MNINVNLLLAVVCYQRNINFNKLILETQISKTLIFIRFNLSWKKRAFCFI